LQLLVAGVASVWVSWKGLSGSSQPSAVPVKPEAATPPSPSTPTIIYYQTPQKQRSFIGKAVRFVWMVQLVIVLLFILFAAIDQMRN
jgi:hypothetical protein